MQYHNQEQNAIFHAKLHREPANGILRCVQKNEAFLEQAASALPDKEAPIVVSCQAGRRGVAATEALLDAKYTNLVHLEGGLNAWAAAGLPVEQ